MNGGNAIAPLDLVTNLHEFLLWYTHPRQVDVVQDLRLADHFANIFDEFVGVLRLLLCGVIQEIVAQIDVFQLST